MAEIPTLIDDLLRLAVEHGASDIHLKTGRTALFRVDGALIAAEMQPLKAEEINAFIDATLPKLFVPTWQKDHQIDYAFDRIATGRGRYRVNAFYQRGTPSVVLRLVKSTPPSLKDIHLDPKLSELTEYRDGIVLVCGPTGSGKSSTLAALLRHLNETADLHVVTLEDPVEYIFADNLCSFSQREVGIDVPGFAPGLRAALRQDPDVVLIGEMRDRETFETALHAAETGHLVLSTLHAGSAQQAVQRLFEFFSPEELLSARRTIASCLRAVIVQTLVPRADGSGVMPACEVFRVDPLARSILSEGHFEKVPDLVDAGKESGSHPMNTDLYALVRSGAVNKAEALARSPNARALEMLLAGIQTSGGRIVK
jgi:twitching motility protein PilT